MSIYLALRLYEALDMAILTFLAVSGKPSAGCEAGVDS